MLVISWSTYSQTLLLCICISGNIIQTPARELILIIYAVFLADYFHFCLIFQFFFLFWQTSTTAYKYTWNRFASKRYQPITLSPSSCNMDCLSFFSCFKTILTILLEFHPIFPIFLIILYLFCFHRFFFFILST